MTSKASRNATSSPAPGYGQLQLDLLAGPTISDCGQPASHASRSRSREKVQVSTTSGICGPTSFASSVPDGPLALWESRLRERLARIGSTECALIWREKVTKHGWSYSRLSPWTPPTSGLDNTGAPWPTPKASNAGPDFAKIERSATGPSLQTVMAGISYWPTPTVACASGGQTSRSGARKGELLLNGLMAAPSAPATWSTPRASDGEKGSPNQKFSAGGQPLPAQMHQASPMVTPSARDWKDTPGMTAERADGKSRIDQIPRQMAATWPTPQAMDGNKGSLPPRPHDTGISLPQRIAQQTEASGPITNGSSATTQKRGAPNPEFACWLMGWPDEFTSGVLRAIQSMPSSPRKSSPRSSKRSAEA